MSFVKNLAKGFVRSTVNQVGRDGGKVISNKVYGDRHGTPIRMTGGNAPTPATEPIPGGMTRGELIDAGYKMEVFSSKLWTYPVMLLGSIIIPFLGGAYWVLNGIKNLIVKKAPFWKWGVEDVYKDDARYKSGKRLVGQKTVKIYADDQPALNPSEKFWFKTKGLVSIAIGIAMIIFWYKIFTNDKEASQELPEVTETVAPD